MNTNDIIETITVRASESGACRRRVVQTEESARRETSLMLTARSALEKPIIDELERRGLEFRETTPNQVEYTDKLGQVTLTGTPDGTVLTTTEMFGFILENRTLGGSFTISADLFDAADAYDLNRMNLEIKTALGNRWREWRTQGVAKAYPAYASQATAYMHLKDIKHTLFVVLDVSTGALLTEILPYEDERWDSLLARWNELIGQAPADVPPDRDGRAIECNWCPVQKGCPAWQDAQTGAKPTTAQADTVLQVPPKEAAWFNDLLRNWAYWNGQEKHAKDMKDLAKDSLGKSLEQHNVRRLQTMNGSVQQVESESWVVDTKAMMQKHPKIVNNFMKQRTIRSVRVNRSVKPENDDPVALAALNAEAAAEREQ